MKAEVSTTLTIRKMARVEDGTRGLLEAKQAADREFDHYFPKIHPYITCSLSDTGVCDLST